MPPYLAGREEEKSTFEKLLTQNVILDNLVLTGLRGVGKTVLLDEFKALGINSHWYWVGTDLSETASLSESNLAIRLLADLAAVTSLLVIGESDATSLGFQKRPDVAEETLNYRRLMDHYEATPGLVVDKLKSTLEMVWGYLRKTSATGLIFAYDEAQNLADHGDKGQFPLSLLLDLFQSIQRKDIPFMLVLVGLPTLFPKLVEARTFAERMFHVLTLDRLSEEDSLDAVRIPIGVMNCPVHLPESVIRGIVLESGGYPYFIQFLCREVYDVALQQFGHGEDLRVSLPDITRKLDSDFFSGRWSKATDRQRDLLRVIATLPKCDDEFTIQDVVEKTKDLDQRPFSASHVSQMLTALAKVGLVYKNRHGHYSFAVPLFGQFIRRQS